ncbi:MAG: hypothetical protein K6A68_14185 [Clostridiales bacterium]|nr:hypothetical protein [Clostridiales bacterium]
MAIVKSKNKQTGITYVYESESYWDAEKKQPRNHRKLIGKLDEDGNIVPTGSRGRKRKDDSVQNDVNDAEDMLSYYRDKSRELETRNALLEDEIRKLKKERKELIYDLEDVLRKYQ